jgi:hypothetical protein
MLILAALSGTGNNISRQNLPRTPESIVSGLSYLLEQTLDLIQTHYHSYCTC